MATFTEIDEILNGDYSPDYWSDEAVLRAAELIGRLDDDGWTRLADAWRERAIRWQARLADALSGAIDSRAADLLRAMVRASDLAVALAAAESLDVMGAVGSPDPSLRLDLQKLRDRVEGGDRQIIDAILGRIPG